MNQTTLPKNEINEIIDIFIDNKKLIVIVTSLITLLAIIYALAIQKPIYEASALIQIAKKNTFIVEDADTVREKLTTIYKIYTHPNQPLPKTSSVEKPKYSKGFLRLTAIAYKKDELTKLLNNSIIKIQQEHNLTIQSYINNQNQIIVNVKKAISITKQKIAQLTQDNINLNIKLNSLDNSQLAQIAISSVVIINNESKIIQLQRDISGQTNYLTAIELTIDTTRTFNSKLVDKVDIHPKPITPRRSIIIVVGFISGLLLAILLSFFLSFVASRRD